MVKNLKLKNGDFALVDDEDYEYLSQWTWSVNYHGYVTRYTSSKGKTIAMHLHREIMKAPKGLQVDHINMNPLDNQKNNLRICTVAENCRNKRKPSSNTTGYKGVHIYNSKYNLTKKYRATIKADDGIKHIGYYQTAEEAARAYNEAALKYHGEFARLNEL